MELWEFWQHRGKTTIHLVVSRHLYRQLVRLPGLVHFREGCPNLIILECTSPASFLAPLLRLAWRAGPGAVFHYPLRGLPLVHSLLRQRLIVSYTANVFFALYAGGWRRKLMFWLQVLGAEKVDVLNPLNFERFRRQPWLKDKVVLNPGSFVDLARYVGDVEKRNWIVFCGRFVEGDPKNAIRFVSAIPAIHAALQRANVGDVRYCLLGEGALEAEMRAMIRQDTYRNIDIEMGFVSAPAEVLKQSRVFVSIQKGSNYPSKSLLEALACGNLPVVTDVGETRMIAAPAFSCYVSADPADAELASAIAGLFSMSPAEWNSKVGMAREFVRTRFDISAHDQHYLRLYGLVPGDAAPDREPQR
ncbi:MAG: glycosyltransferase [Acidobacteriota bacterium]|nr:glycosyltransferase [Acidobacteriota bacterium]